MINPTQIHEAMRQWPQLEAKNDGEVLVPTHCLYPSNGVVVVAIDGGVSLYRVHDRAGAVEEFLSAGARRFPHLSSIRHIARRQGLTIDDAGRVVAPLVQLQGIAGAVSIVANVSKEIAHHLVDRFRPHVTRDIHVVLSELLERQFPTEMRRAESVVGRSNKPHKFDFMIRLPQERRLLVDAVTPEASSINAAVVSHLDVASADLPGIVQRIVFDDALPWKASDLSLLTVGARAVPFSRIESVLNSLKAA